MADMLCKAGYERCKVDPDVWMKPKIKPNSEKYWEYVLIYIDNILVMPHQPKVVMDYIASKYILKEGSVKELEAYLGG